MSSVKKKPNLNLFTLYTSWNGQSKDRNLTAGINAHKVSYPLAHLSPGLSFKNHGRYFMKSFSFGLPWIDFPIGHPIHTEELSEKKILKSARCTSTWSQSLNFFSTFTCTNQHCYWISHYQVQNCCKQMVYGCLMVAFHKFPWYPLPKNNHPSK